MSRYTGSNYRKSRRFGFSILENGKELSKNHMHQVNMEMIVVRNFQTMVHNYKKNKKLDLCMV